MITISLKRIIIFLIIMIILTLQTKAFLIPVHDYSKYIQDKIAHKLKMYKLDKILQIIADIKRIERETREFYQNIYQAMQKSKIISARDMLWHIMNSTFFKDMKRNDPWWSVWNSKKKLSELFPEIADYSYLTDNLLYKKSPRYKKYIDQQILQIKEREIDLENLREHMNLMRKSYIKNIKQINLFSNRLEEFSASNQVGKLIALLANLELMNARLNLQLNFNRRVQDTINLKRRVTETAGYNNEANLKGLLGWKDEKYN